MKHYTQGDIHCPSTGVVNPWSHKTQQTHWDLPQKAELILEARKAYWCPEDLPPSKNTINFYRWPDVLTADPCCTQPFVWCQCCEEYVFEAWPASILRLATGRSIRRRQTTPGKQIESERTIVSMWNQGLGYTKGVVQNKFTINSCLIEYNIQSHSSSFS